jgi:tetratricopeptide (TPR) repeat protein
MKKRKVIFPVIVLVIAGAFVFIIKNRDYFFEKYEWYKAEERAGKRCKELMGKAERKEKLSSMEVGEIAAYFQLASKYDEGIRALEEIKKQQDDYVVYFSLSGLHAYRARATRSVDERKELALISRDYMMEGFRRVPEKPLAYHLRGKAYGLLGCTELSVDDFNRAIEESKGADKIMFGDGFYVDRQRFVSIVEQDIDNYKRFTGDCLLRRSTP